MKTYKTEGIVIKRRNLGEADKILTILTKKLGKLQVKAPGIRRIISRRSPHVELLNYVSFSLYCGKSLPVVTEAEAIETFSLLKENLGKISTAYHTCELVDNFCPDNQENYDIFVLLKNTLLNIERSVDSKNLIKKFELDLLTKLGYIQPIPMSSNFNTTAFIEQLLEKKLKSRQIAPFLS
ncbi:MAG: DNA repair protein RecO [Candidatus Levyibacteriota bacterium]